MPQTIALFIALTLAHTLWLGGVVLLVHLAVRRLLLHASAAARYRLALGSSVALLLLPLALAGGGLARLRLLDRPEPVAAAVLPRLPERIERPALSAHLALTPIAGAIAGIWLAGMVVAFGVVLVGLIRLRQHTRHAARWPVAAADLPCPVLLSPTVGAPCAVGWRRPLILLPASLARTLPAEDLLALLRHEAAHVRRHDFGINLVHRVLLAPLWFHPGVGWLGRQLRAEREQCCDEQSLRGEADRLPLARALVRLAEQRPAAPRLAVAGSDGELGQRVRRLLQPHNARAPRGIFAGAALAAGLGGLALLGVADLTGGLIARDLLRVRWGVQAIWAEDPAGQFTLLLSRGRVFGAQLDGTQLPESRIVQQADRISLLGTPGTADLVIHLEPGGGFRWTPRRPGPS
jgi:beta-lactamase regulating signal transducer with metallopeptidase domain